MANVQSYIAVFLALVKLSECGENRKAMEGFIVGGDYTTIANFPHAVYLSINCNEESWICGGSVVNQRILVSAAHCFNRCGDVFKIKCLAGHEDIKKASAHKILTFKYHEQYSEEELSYDLAIAAVAELPLGDNIKRVVIPIKFPQNVKKASVAGWGLTDDTGARVTTTKLKMVDQVMRDAEKCEEVIGELESGTFCAGEFDSDVNRPSMGDSGSGLIYNTRIQIGLVSYRVDEHPGIMVYTNITYFYDWIEQTAKSLYCNTVSVKVKHTFTTSRVDSDYPIIL